MRTFYNIDLDSYNINSDYVSQIINTYGCWEPIMTNVMLNILSNESGTCFDVGTFIGYYTFLFAKYNNLTIGLEADKITYGKILNTKIKHNIDKVILYNNAVSSEDNLVLNFYHSNLETNVGGSCITKLEGNSKITTIKLDSIIEQNNIDKILILKIDVEGHEMDCIKGFEKGLKNKIAKYIFLESSPKMVGIDESVEIVETITNAGYKCYDLGIQESGELDRYKNYDYRKHQIFNIRHFILDNKVHQRDLLFEL